jgi:hypothetical protein
MGGVQCMFMVTLEDLGNFGDFVGGIMSIVGAFGIWVGYLSLRYQYLQLEHQIEEAKKANMPEVEIEIMPDESGIKVILINPKNTPIFLKEYFLKSVTRSNKITVRFGRSWLTKKKYAVDSGWEIENRVLQIGHAYYINLNLECFKVCMDMANRIRHYTYENEIVEGLELVLNIYGMPKKIINFSFSHGAIFVNSKPVLVTSINKFNEAINNGLIEFDFNFEELVFADESTKAGDGIPNQSGKDG